MSRKIFGEQREPKKGGARGLLNVERLAAFGLAAGVERDLFYAGLGLPQQLLATPLRASPRS